MNAADLVPVVLDRTVELVRIPAPTGSETGRAEAVRRWWREEGWRPTTDAAGNVWVRAVPGAGPGLLVCAHLDTVFPASVAHEVTVEGERLTGPSVGDDSVGVASLPAVASLLAADEDGGTGGPVWLVATVAEEGMGNLAGISYALAHPPGRVGAVIAVEGNYLGRIVNTGVGSVRWRVRYRGPGGHAWERADAPSAVHAAARACSQLADLAVAGARCSVNIGTVGGGEAINARAREAWFEADFRADAGGALASLADQARAIVAAAGGGLEVEITELGRRPAGGTGEASPLVRAAVAGHEKAGVPVRFGAASTDANAAYGAGLPAIAIGVTTGEGEHTPAEWIDAGPLAAGLTAVAETIRIFLRERP